MATTPEKFTFFYHAESPFSQFHYAKFTAAPINFHNAEEELEVQEFSSCEMWMMYNKAKLFKDEDIATKILNTEEPFKCKKLGRQVREKFHNFETLKNDIRRICMHIRKSLKYVFTFTVYKKKR